MVSPTVFEPSDDFQAKRQNDRDRAQDDRLREESGKVQLPRYNGLPFDATELPTEVNGMRVEVTDKPELTVKAFYRSQLRDPEFYRVNKPAILEAQRHNLIIDDVTDPKVAEALKAQRKEAENALSASNEAIMLPIALRDARAEADKLYVAYKAAEAENQRYLSTHGIMGDDEVRRATARVVFKAKEDWEAASARIQELVQKNNEMCQRRAQGK